MIKDSLKIRFAYSNIYYISSYDFERKLGLEILETHCALLAQNLRTSFLSVHRDYVISCIYTPFKPESSE